MWMHAMLMSMTLSCWQTGINRAVLWSFDNMYSEEECWTQMRFQKSDLILLSTELAIDAGRGFIRTAGSGSVFQPIEALVVFLTRMAYPNRWEDKIKFLGGRARGAYVEAFYYVLDFIYDNFKHCITDITRWAGNMDEWADAIHAAGAPAPRCVGFIDGTFRPCARPGGPNINQRQVYSGYKKLHGIKFQSVTSVNGLIVDFFGSAVGRRGDGYLLRKSHFLVRMAALCALEGSPFYVYGDPAYSLSQYILRGYKGAMTPQQQAFRTAMSSVRESVEWGFDLIVRDWAFVDYRKNLKIHKQPIGRLYFVAALLTNMKTCITAAHTFDYHGNQISQMFGVSPPSLHDYLYA